MISTTAAGGSDGGCTGGRKTAAVIDLDSHHYGIGLHRLDLRVRLRSASVYIRGVGMMTVIGILNGRIRFILNKRIKLLTKCITKYMY